METLAKRLDEVASSAPYEFNVRDALIAWREKGTVEQECSDCLAQLFGYMLVGFDQADLRQENAGPFGPMYEFQDGQRWPERFQELPDDCLSLAAEVASHAQDPMVVARIADVLWERRWGDEPYRYAETAIRAYLDFPSRQGSEHHDLTCVQMADRALELAMRLSNRELTMRCRDALVSVGRESMEAPDPGLGVVGSAVRALLRLPSPDLPTELGTMLDRAEEVFGADPWAVEAVYDFRVEAARGDPESQRQFQDAQIEALIKAAEDAPHPFLKHAYLERAASRLHARSAPQAERMRVARLLEDAPLREEDFGRVSSEISLSAEDVQALIEPAKNLTTWQEALEWFGLQGPPTGDPDENLAVVEEQSKSAPLQWIVPKVLYNADGLPILRAESEDERRQYALAMKERLGLQLWGQLYFELVLRVVERDDFPDIEELRAFFVTPTITEPVADAIARSIMHFRNEDYDESAHVLIPRIETVVRAIASAAGLATAFLPTNERQGGYVSLNVLFERLRAVGLPDEAWRRYGEHLLVDPLGANLRNEVCHGLIASISSRDAALLLHYACHLRLLRVGSPPV